MANTPAKATVLCIDDEPIGLMVRARLLESAGYSVLSASDGPSGIQLFRSQPVDLVVLDYLMPRMNGDEVARRLRSLHAATPIILLSAYVDLPPEVTSLADLCLVKGVDPEELLEQVGALLQSRREAHS